MSHSLTPYVDPLPIPPVIRANGWPICVDARVCRQKIHRDLFWTTLWAYGGTWPGPTIEVRRGDPVSIQWTNSLPAQHMLPIDNTIHRAEKSLPPVRTVAHVHGAAVAPESDGYPDAWFTARGEIGPAFVSAISQYPNEQPAATLWYHDHCLGITRLNIYAGLAVFYLIRDEAEDADFYTLSDNFHQSVMGGTGANHIMFGFGDAIWYSDGKGKALKPPTEQIENPNPQKGTDNYYDQDGYSGGSYVNCYDLSQPGAA